MFVHADGSVTGSINRAALAALSGDVEEEAGPDEGPAKASHRMSKGELVDLAEGLELASRDELDALTKGDLIDLINAEEADDGNHDVP